MEIHRSMEMKSELKCDDPQTVTSKSVKRPFDVAFLMLPDEKMKHKAARIAEEQLASFNNNDEDEEIDVEDKPPQKLVFTQRQQIFDDPSIVKTKTANLSSNQKSAFTKVNVNFKDSRHSPSLSVSPDLSYQSSLSPSPPISNRTYQNFPATILTPNQIFKNQQIAYQNQFLPENFQHAASSLENTFFKGQPELVQPNFAKLRPSVYRPDLPYNYQHFQAPEMLKLSPPELRNPAAAILTSLLPPSLAALSLPAQNVCAKCNISFRMTSDLVYHMRSHHKNDSSDMSKKRREDKLKCPVCAESFRERHHLTRHMTAHQDKDEDEKDTKKGY